MDKIKILEQMKQCYDQFKEMGFNKRQIDEIYNGLRSDMDINIINKYADPDFDFNQMAQIKAGLKEGINILKYANPVFNEETLEAIRYDLKIHKEKEKAVKKKEPELEI